MLANSPDPRVSATSRSAAAYNAFIAAESAAHDRRMQWLANCLVILGLTVVASALLAAGYGLLWLAGPAHGAILTLILGLLVGFAVGSLTAPNRDTKTIPVVRKRLTTRQAVLGPDARIVDGRPPLA